MFNSIYRLLFVLSLVIISSCSNNITSVEVDDLVGGEREVRFSVQIPGSALPQNSTRALTGDDENEVSMIDIVLFKEGIAMNQLIYTDQITSESGASNRKTFTVKIPEGTYDIAVFANAHRELSTAYSNNYLDGRVTKEQLYGMLKTSNKLYPDEEYVWNSDPQKEGYRAIPMWGEINSFTVSGNTSTDNPVKLVRALAKVNVNVSQSLQDRFKLTSVMVYNYPVEGLLVPHLENWDASKNSVKNPSAIRSMSPEAITYAVGAPYKSLVGSIYSHETRQGVSGEEGLKNNTCLVIGGIFGDSGVESYYRIDFTQKSSEGLVSYLPLLRNHAYNVNLMSINSRGYDDPKTAFESTPINIEAGLVVLNESEITDFVYDWQFVLGVSSNEYLFNPKNQTITDYNNLTISTDNPSGWKLVGYLDATGRPLSGRSWFSLATTKGDVGSTTTSIIVDEPVDNNLREGIIRISSGLLELDVKVAQSKEDDLMLSLQDVDGNEIEEMVFTSLVDEYPEPQTINVLWSPKLSQVSVTEASGSAESYYDNSAPYWNPSQALLSDAEGKKQLNIRLTKNTIQGAEAFLDRVGALDFSVKNEAGQVSKKTVIIRQKTRGIRVTGLLDTYHANNVSYSFNVLSSGEWIITKVSDPNELLGLKADDNLRAGIKFTADTGDGNVIKFTTKNTKDDKKREGFVVVDLATMDGITKTIVLNIEYAYIPQAHGGFAASNIYWDGEKMTFDEVLNADGKNGQFHGLYFKQGGLWAIPITSNKWVNFHVPIHKNQGNGYALGPAPIWEDIPYVTRDVKLNPDRAYIYEVYDPERGSGDICHHLTIIGTAPGADKGVKWRLPTGAEIMTALSGSDIEHFGSLPGAAETEYTPNSGGFVWDKYWVANLPDDPNGKLIIPSAGFRDHIGLGSSRYMYLATSSLYYYIDGELKPFSYNMAVPVRCVKVVDEA